MKVPDRMSFFGVFRWTTILLLLLSAAQAKSGSLDPFDPRLADILRQPSRGTVLQNAFHVVAGVSLRGGALDASDLRVSSASLDALARSVTLSLGLVVSFQAGLTAMFSHRGSLLELASRVMGDDTVSAARTIHKILDTVDDHGVIDVFSKHEPKQIISSIYALSKLQAACQRHERESTLTTLISTTTNKQQQEHGPAQELLQDLYECAPFAAAAYGWKLDLATAGKLHRGDLHALVKMTNIDPSDVVTVNWESRPNRPAFYIARDRKRKRIILSIRGTWSPHDVLTDLCCTPEDYSVSSQRRYRAHTGMLEAARGVASQAKETIQQESRDHPDYNLLLVGHSLGGSVAAILGTLWEKTFSFCNVTVYAYGPACVSPTLMNDNTGTTIVSVLLEGDPFSCLSLGHVADVSGALDYLCQHPDLRSAIRMRTDGPVHQLESRDLEWCSQRMEEMQENMILGEKLYPPGRLLFIHKSKHTKKDDCEIEEVPPEFFRYLKIGPRMFDLSRHVPRLYEASLRHGIAKAQKKRNHRI